MHRLLGSNPVAVLSLAVLSLAVLALSPVEARPASQDDGGSVLHEAMEGLKDNLKGLAGAVRDPSRRADSLRHVAEMQRLVLAAKLESPPNLDQIEEAKRDAHKTAFRVDMARLLGTLAELEIDVLESRSADAMAKITGSLFRMREASHEKFQRKD